jgi:hypothetical protein
MKKIFNIIILTSFVGLISCEDDAFKDNVALGESINDFELESPANFSALLLNASQSNKIIDVQWNAAVTGLGTAPTYRFLLDEKGGDFSTPLLSLESDNAGIDNGLSLTYGQLIDAVSGAVSTEYIWTVEAQVVATKGTNKHNARISFDLDLSLSSEGITDFSYLAPIVNEKLAFDKFGTPNDIIEFSWEAATSLSGDAVSYKIQFNNPDGDFSNPLFESDSDNGGVDTTFSITHADLKDLVDGITYEDGVNWRVVATVGGFEYSPGVQYVRFDPANAGPLNLYLVGGSSTAGWDPSASIPFVSTAEGKWEIYAYLDPAGGGIKFLEVQDWAGDWGMSPGNAGTLEQDGEDNVTVTTIGFYRIYVDFTSNSYSVDEVLSWGIIGSATPNGWNDPDVDMVYVGGVGNLYTWQTNVTLIDGEIKFRANDDWGINYGDTGADGILDAGGDNVAVVAGDYLVKLILDPDTGFTYQLISGPSNLYLVGGSTSADWNPAASIPFINNGDGTFEIYAYFEVAGGGFKFLEIQDWAGDWGMSPGNPGVLEQATEDNVTVPLDGFYRVFVNFNTGTYSVTETNWGIIGSATPNGWNDPDTNMALSSATKGNYTWTVDITLTDGEIKFRANDGWDINYGDDGTDGILDSGGANIAVTAGIYTISMTLDPLAGYTYTIN